MTDTFWTPEPDDTDAVAELWRMEGEARAARRRLGETDRQGGTSCDAPS